MLNLRNVSLHLGSTVLLDQANLSIEHGERLCLLGRNGQGKSTLLRAIAGELAVDSGEISRAQGLKVAQLPQDVPRDLPGTVWDVIASGLGEAGAAIAAYHHALEREPDDLEKIGDLQHRVDALNAWQLDARVEAVLTRLGLDGEAAFAALSGGFKRRTLLARALVAEPDLLLLDEPTNHLDIDSIAWLEDFLASWNGTLLFVTHDRALLRRLATRIVELDRGRLQSWEGGYDDYLRRREEVLHAEAKQNALFDKRLAQEEAWIRKGVEARRTRSIGRVQRLMQMREQYAQRRTLEGTAKLQLQEAEKSGKLVAEAQKISFARGDNILVRNFSTTILRGDKIGIVGPNGAGKTTLLQLLLGKLAPDSGTLKLGTKQEVAYFDQLRAQLEEDKPVYQNIGDGKEFVEVNGVRRHVMSYLQDFLFGPDRARSPVRVLSGGERSRLLLARLFATPANVVVLDEPTNDLDLETLDLLEDLLVDYGGTVLLVSHDREFLDNVATRCLVFEGGGRIGDYVGGYADAQRQRTLSAAHGQQATLAPARAPVAAAGPGRGAGTATPAAVAAAGSTTTSPRGAMPAVPVAAAATVKRLGQKELRELDALPGKIERLETEQRQLGELLSDADVYRRERDKAAAAQARLSEIEQVLAQAYARWEQLEALR